MQNIIDKLPEEYSLVQVLLFELTSPGHQEQL